MEKAFAIKDMRSFEFSSPSELDRNFFGEQMSSLSLEQLSTSRVSNETASDGCDARLSSLALHYLSTDRISPTTTISVSTQDKDNSFLLAVPLQGNSSTPCLLLQKQQNAAPFDQSFTDLTASQISWDMSLIKSESPKLNTEPNPLELTSPNPSKHVAVSP